MNTESKSRYKTTNWSEYNQALRQRGAFTIWFDPQMQWSATPSGKKGRQPTYTCLLYTSPSPRDRTRSRMPSSA